MTPDSTVENIYRYESTEIVNNITRRTAVIEFDNLEHRNIIKSAQFLSLLIKELLSSKSEDSIKETLKQAQTRVSDEEDIEIQSIRKSHHHVGNTDIDEDITITTATKEPQEIQEEKRDVFKKYEANPNLITEEGIEDAESIRTTDGEPPHSNNKAL